MNKKLILTLSVTGLCLSTSAQNVSAFSGLNAPQNAAHSQSENIITIAQDPLEQRAQDFIKSLSEEGIGFLTNQDMSAEQREKAFRKLLKKNFDMKTIGRFALGRYWKTSSKEEQNKYLTLFENMIVEVYSRRFSEYNGEALEITSARPEGKSDALVKSVIVPQSGPKVSVDWRVRKKKDGSLKVVDILVEGVSMSLTQRSDFASVIQRGGGKIDVLLAHLEKK